MKRIVCLLLLLVGLAVGWWYGRSSCPPAAHAGQHQGELTVRVTVKNTVATWLCHVKRGEGSIHLSGSGAEVHFLLESGSTLDSIEVSYSPSPDSLKAFTPPSVALHKGECRGEELVTSFAESTGHPQIAFVFKDKATGKLLTAVWGGPPVVEGGLGGLGGGPTIVVDGDY